MVDKATLISIENNREITMEQDLEFMFQCQKAMLLTLKEWGTLSDEQYQYAEFKLKEQKQEYVKKCLAHS